jgi:hypothetical protein
VSITGTPVYVSGSSASQPVLQALASIIGSSVAILYQSPDSCLGLNDVITGMPSSEAGTNLTWLKSDGTAVSCMTDSTYPLPVPDIGVSDVFVQTCEDAGIFSLDGSQKLAEVQGPIQAMTIVAPSTSMATSISTKAAYVVFGYGGNTYTVPQWNDPTAIYDRAYTSGTLNMIGSAIGLAPTKWAHSYTSNPDGGALPMTQGSGTGDEFSKVSGQSTMANASATIGILSYEGAMQGNAKAVSAAGNGKTVKILPYQHTGQSCGYLPDSTSQSPDRINVRQGRYAIWGPLHFIVNVDASGYPTGHNPDAIATVLNYFVGTGPKAMGMTDAQVPVQVAPFAVPGSDAGVAPSAAKSLITAESTVSAPGAGVVPWCAMQVARSAEVGPEVSYQPDASCGCFFEKTATGAPVSSYCQLCSSSSDCTNPLYPNCNFGFCEAQ